MITGTSIPTAINAGAHIERDEEPTLSVPGRRDQLGYLILVELQARSPGGAPVNYRSISPGHDAFELRSAASWLVGAGYARWAHGTALSITDHGRQAVASI